MRYLFLLLIPALLFGQWQGFKHNKQFKSYEKSDEGEQVDPYLIADWTYASGLTYDGSNYVSSWLSAQGLELIQTGGTTKPLWSAADSMVVFDGSNDYMTTSGESSTMDLGTSNFTFVFWIYTTNYNQGKRVFGKYETTSDTYYATVQFNTILFYAFESGAEKIRINPTATTLTNSTKYHIAITYNGTNGICYVDGRGVATTTTTAVAADIVSNAEFRLGNWGGSYFNGKIGRFTFYKRELTAAEVQAHYEATR